MTDKTENPVLFRFKTVQTNAIRILFESLKNILSDVNFKADNTGLKLTTIDGTNSAIVNLFLQKEKFEEYICSRVTNIGVNLLSVFKILKGIKHSDTISFTIYENEDGHSDQCLIGHDAKNATGKRTQESRIKRTRHDTNQGKNKCNTRQRKSHRKPGQQ